MIIVLSSCFLKDCTVLRSSPLRRNVTFISIATVCVYVYVCVDVHMGVCACVHVHMGVCVCVDVHMGVCACVHVHMGVCVCVDVHMGVLCV